MGPEAPLGIAYRCPAIVNRTFHTVPGDEQRMVGEPDHRPQTDHLSNRILEGVGSEARVMARPEVKMTAVP